MRDGAYLTLEVTFGGGQPARATYGGGVLSGSGDVDLREVMARDALSGAIRNVVKELGEHELAEIRQQIAYKHSKEG